MKLTRYNGAILGFLAFALTSLLAQIGASNSTGGILGYFQNAAVIFNCTAFFIPSLVSSLIFQAHGTPVVIAILLFSLLEFLLLGFFLGKDRESKRQF
jgi:phosphoglycerol transferase MdoB-like AlkP superfamily enzyme